MDGLWFRVRLPPHRCATRAATLNRRKPNDRPLFLADRKRQEDRYSPRGVVAVQAGEDGEARSVTDQAAGSGVLAPLIDRRNGMARCQRHELLAPAVEERIGADDEAAGVQLDESHEGRVD